MVLKGDLYLVVSRENDQASLDRMKRIGQTAEIMNSQLQFAKDCQDMGRHPVDEKEKIFTMGFGKGTGLGLYLSREILTITLIKIMENGEPGKDIRFEIEVPDDLFRFNGTSGP
jgi:hypothetical protein